MRDRFVQVGIEFLPLGVDRLETVVGEEISQLLQDHVHPGVNRRFFAFAFRGGKAELEVVDDRDQALEERAVGVFDRLLFLAGGALLEVIEIGLAAQGEIAKTIEIGLQAGGRIVVVVSGDPASGATPLGLRAGRASSVTGIWRRSDLEFFMSFELRSK